MIKVGLGYDLHRLVEGRKLLLGGIHIPFERGEDGHSDGHVLLHAISDALLGASGLGDIGSFFPPEEPQWKDADSAQLLKTVVSKVYDEGWKIENLDCVIKLEKPKKIEDFKKKVSKLKTKYQIVEVSAVSNSNLEKPKFIPYRTQVIKSIADILQIDENQVFVKAKTGEKLAEIGRSEAVEVWCVCLLSR